MSTKDSELEIMKINLEKREKDVNESINKSREFEKENHELRK